jgi:hypothetical protein
MLSRLPFVSSLAVLAAFSVNCSSGAGAPTTSSPSTTPLESTVDTGTAPCNLKTSFGDVDGDSQCILPPDPAHGAQFHYGPTNYNDPVEVAKYTLQPGGEVTDCIFVMSTNTDTEYFNSYHNRMRAGSHHMLLYIQDSSSGPSLGGAGGGISLAGSNTPIVETGSNGPSDCNQSTSFRMLFGAQTATTDIDGLTANAAENIGLAVAIPPTQQVVLQAHFINATSHAILREDWANIIYTPKDQVTQLGDPISFIGGVLMNVPMGQSQAITGSATVPAGVAPDFRLIMATGHYHAHTTEFTAWATVNGQKQQIIQEFGILGVAPEPKFWYFDSAKQNPTPDLATQTAGSASGILHMQPGDTINWECDVTNNNVTGGIQFANAVYTGEMCNIFGLYAPSTGAPWTALSL